MKFGVIVCQSCQHASGVNLKYKTTNCPYCGKKFKLNPKKIKHQSNSEKDLIDIISTINRELGTTRGPNHGSSVSDFGSELLKSSDSEHDIKDTIEKEPVYEKMDPYQRIAMKHKEKKDSIDFIIEITKDLALELGEFHTDDFRKVLYACNLNVNKVDEYLEQLRNNNIIYEPKLGIFKILND